MSEKLVGGKYDMSRVKKVKLELSSVQDSLNRFKEVWKKAEEGTPVEPEEILSFPDLATLLEPFSLVAKEVKVGPVAIMNKDQPVMYCLSPELFEELVERLEDAQLGRLAQRLADSDKPVKVPLERDSKASKVLGVAKGKGLDMSTDEILDMTRERGEDV